MRLPLCAMRSVTPTFILPRQRGGETRYFRMDTSRFYHNKLIGWLDLQREQSYAVDNRANLIEGYFFYDHVDFSESNDLCCASIFRNIA